MNGPKLSDIDLSTFLCNKTGKIRPRDVTYGPKRIEIINNRVIIPQQRYPSYVLELIEGIQVLVLKGEPKCGKTSLAYYLLDKYARCDEIGIIEDDGIDCKIPKTPYIIIENATEINSYLINRIIESSDKSKVIITTQDDLIDDCLHEVNRKIRFVEITQKLYKEDLTFEYETCSFP